MSDFKVTIKIEGTTLALTPDEAKVLFDLLEKGRTEAEIVQPKGWNRTASVTESMDNRLLKVLSILRSAGEAGVPMNELTRAAGYQKRRAISAVQAYANRRFLLLDLAPAKVMCRGEGAVRDRWFAGKLLPHAIEKLTG